MGRIINFRDLLGLIKDKASLSKAALLSNPNALSIRLAVLRATTHTPRAPPDDHHISTLLLLGESSRATASPIITALMDRLHRTGNSVVALKCLLIIHHIIKRGPFILQDQLSIYPATGGYNYLKLSAFRDGATATTWALSSCMVKENQEHRISSFLNLDLIKDIDSIVTLIEEICNVPDSLAREGDMLVKEIMGLLLNDYVSSVNEILLRLGEINERLGWLSFGDSIELVCAMKRLQDCQERLSVLYLVRKPSIEMMWGLVEELKDKVASLKVYKEGGNLLSLKASESARFDQRVLATADSVGFRSGRFDVRQEL
ncbi:UNVERIFIED_CONTAM: putative clathrin assembly protein [Sesamum angustifolium]|uniref:Clathrin assembly protein n=1 Tax=Sesamum angustifolium TaxID=2727405 RepID=A0AAW2NJM3_9LAMI